MMFTVGRRVIRYNAFYMVTGVFITTMWANAQVMAALPNIGGALWPSVQRRSLADAHY